jgi:hypothetical protein
MHSICCSVHSNVNDLKYMTLCKNVLMFYTFNMNAKICTFMECLLNEILVIVTVLFEYHKYCVPFSFQIKIQLYCWVLH